MARKVFLLIFMFIILFGFSSASVFFDDTQAEFNQGTYSRTFFNTTGNFVQLNFTFTTGNYTSRIFDSQGNGNWNKISWRPAFLYGFELPNSQGSDEIYFNRPANMSGNTLLIHMNELSANSAPGGSDVQDFSGNGRHGNESGGVTFNQAGKYNASIKFDGSNDYLIFGNSSLFNTRRAITIEAWVRPAGTINWNNFPTLVDKDPFEQFSLYFNGAQNLVFDLNYTNGNVTLIGTTVASTNTWYHVVATYDGSTASLYLNGVLEDSDSASGNLASGAKDLLVGAGWNGGSKSFNFRGRIDEVAIYNQSLSPPEISDHYSRAILKMNMSVRSCDDVLCAGESFFGNYTSPPQNLSVIANRYFQYRTDFSSEVAGKYPELYNVLIDYSSSNSPPNISMVYPLNSTYPTVTSLNYTVSDSNVQTCWYSLNNGVTNITVVCGQNLTGLNAPHGNNTWAIFANDSFGLTSSSSSSFFVDALTPGILIIFPTNASYYAANKLGLNYTVSDSNVQTCWYSLNNGVTNITVVCGQNISEVTANEGANIWSVFANDSFGRVNVSTVSFTVDTLFPNINLIEPSGTKTTRTNIPLVFYANDTHLETCLYNVYRGITLEIANTSIICSAGQSFFNVTIDANFRLNFYANDSAGNLNWTFSDFSVNTAGGGTGGDGGSAGGGTGAGGGGSSGGGGGSGSFSSGNRTRDLRITSQQLEPLILKRGEQGEIRLQVTNNDVSFINSCKLVFSGAGEEFLSNSQEKGLARGEKYIFIIDVNIPSDAEPEEYSADVKISCDEGQVDASVDFGTYRTTFEASIVKYEKVENELRVSYNLQEFAGVEHDIVLNYALLDFDGIARYRGSENIVLAAKQATAKVVAFELPKDSFGEFNFEMEFSDGVEIINASQDVFLPSSNTIAGFVISETTRKRLSVFGIVFVSLAALFFIIRAIYKFKRKTKNIGKERDTRKLIKLDL